MWPFTDRRKKRRYEVSWQAVLHADFNEEKTAMDVSVVEVSLAGARLEMPSLLTGSKHVLAGQPTRLVLEILLSEGLFAAPIRFQWARYEEDIRKFHVGVSFEDPSRESLSVLEAEFRTIRRATA
ncbi:MAG: PilZ domain-containing protein [Desulfacinum sp.]|nr:PilZ domain-containing protein [Desulfacinum sp.]